MAVNYISRNPAACIVAEGEDAPRFLQSQFSNDLEGPPERCCAYGLWLDRKGRIVADSHVLRIGPLRYLLFSYESPAAIIREKLEAFIIADDVTLTDRTAAMGCTSFWGEGTEALLRNWGFRIPARGEFVDQGGILLFQGRRSACQSYDLAYPEDAGDWVLQRLNETGNGQSPRKATAAEVDLERIRSGIPGIPRDCGADSIPQELGMEAAVSFTKGCFIGQEVMARVRQTGRYTRQLVQVQLSANPGALPAALSADGEETPAGTLTSAVADGGTWLGFALVRRKLLDQGVQTFTSGSVSATVESKND